MLYDYTIREEDRHDIIGALTIALSNGYKNQNNLLGRVLTQQLHNRILFGCMSAKALFKLLVQVNASVDFDPFALTMWERGNLNWGDVSSRPSDYFAYNAFTSAWDRTTEEDIPEYVPFEPPEMIPPKSSVALLPTDTELGRSLTGRVLPQDMVYYDQYPIVKYIEPKRLEFFIKRPTIRAPGREKATELLTMIDNTRFMLQFPHTLNAYPQG